jgi:hypothetical protein
MKENLVEPKMLNLTKSDTINYNYFLVRGNNTICFSPTRSELYNQDIKREKGDKIYKSKMIYGVSFLYFKFKLFFCC